MRPTIRLLLLFLVGILSPAFFPTPRDYIETVYQTSPAPQLVAQLRDEAAPATLAIIREARSRAQSGNPVVTVVSTTVNGERVTAPVPATGDYSLTASGCSVTAEQVEATLVEYGSPAAGLGIGDWSVQECIRTKIDNAVWLAMFIHESGAGSAGAWAGNKGSGNYTANTGNIVCAGYGSCYGRFRDYNNDWKLGTTQHFELLACYRDGGGEGCSGLWSGKAHATVRDALNTWAPPVENDTNAYADYVESQIDTWRRINQGQFVTEGPEGPAEPAPPMVPQPAVGAFSAPAEAASKTISFSGAFGQNVRSIINSSPDLQSVSIPPGGSFSFNERWIINGDGMLTTYVVYGGGACNVAGAYSNVSRQLGLTPVFTHHGITLAELPWEDAVSIWSSGSRGGQDLIVDNPTDKTLRFEAELGESSLTVRGWFE